MNKGFIISAVIMMFLCAKAYAAAIDSVIYEAGVNRGTVLISVKDISTGKTVYALNKNCPIPPASTLKLLTFSAATDTLGKDYEFTTSLYSNKNNELILKLGADPYLTSSNINSLITAAKDKKIISPKAFYIDDYITDKNEWGEGWQWDDDLNPLMPKFSAYNLDKNLLSVIIAPTRTGAPAQIHTTKFYPVSFLNLVTSGAQNNISFSRRNHISPDAVAVEGTVSSQVTRNIPVNNPQRYFILRLEEAIRHDKLDYYGEFQPKKADGSLSLIKEIKHPLLPDDILKNSSNLAAETVFKLAGGKFSNETGSQENAYKMLEAYAQKIGLNLNGAKIADGSGVSKNNLVTADFMTNFLVLRAGQEDFEEFKKMLPTAGEGTLANRMLYFRDNIRAKTGTLSNISAIAGYITAKSGKTYAFDIMINDPETDGNDKKALEEHILRAIQAKY
ncbi:MAG: D-alanyl-D-alanine carboxypeptidase/D-alanyl-D-alanine-endopeptidase [Heliobacteriaceae bacterium]|jgi:D-alanyl-D-alanine carboxypeptidase/D-alanyl-D-alanine-endopeptidase (penicillin-binding protein 4)|nr:D-alanyl-D-alanine carboxypeptidase/D-alanyl-D-alanine-endopeptidase [Heliobacteriaceae bacterium]